MPSSSTTQRLIYEVVFQHDHPMAPMRYQCEECGAIPIPTPSGKMGLQWVVPVEPDHEVMAEALWESETPVLGFEQPWADQPEVIKDEYREAAKRVWRAGIGDTDER